MKDKIKAIIDAEINRLNTILGDIENKQVGRKTDPSTHHSQEIEIAKITAQKAQTANLWNKISGVLTEEAIAPTHVPADNENMRFAPTPPNTEPPIYDLDAFLKEFGELGLAYFLYRGIKYSDDWDLLVSTNVNIRSIAARMRGQKPQPYHNLGEWAQWVEQQRSGVTEIAEHILLTTHWERRAQELLKEQPKAFFIKTPSGKFYVLNFKI